MVSAIDIGRLSSVMPRRKTWSFEHIYLFSEALGNDRQPSALIAFMRYPQFQRLKDENERLMSFTTSVFRCVLVREEEA